MNNPVEKALSSIKRILKEGFLDYPSARKIVLNNFNKGLLEKASQEVLRELWEKYPQQRHKVEPYMKQQGGK